MELVTGVNGFIGSTLYGVLKARSSAERVYGIGRGGSQDSHVVTAELDPSHDPLPNIRFTTIYQFAGRPAVYASSREPVEDARQNLWPTLWAVERARRDGARVVQASSGEVYGSRGVPWNEEAPARPATVYGLHKWMSEEYLHLYQAHFGVPYLCLRIAAVYGPGWRRNILYDLLSGFVEGREEIPIFCTLDSVVDLVHVHDVVSAVEFCVERGLWNMTFNVASGEPLSVREIYGHLSDHFGCRPRLVVKEKVSVRKVFDIASLRSHGWEPQRHLSSTLEDLIATWPTTVSKSPSPS